MRADEHEGDLNSTENKRVKDRMEKESRRIIRDDLLLLTENEHFLRWFGRYGVGAVMQNVPVNNGSTLAHFMGKRELVLTVIDEFEQVSPGFFKRMLTVREQFERDLQAAAMPREEQ